MVQVIERREFHMEEIEHPGYSCECGRGFSIDNSYGVKDGDPCDICGEPLEYVVITEIRKYPAVVLITCDCGAKVECEAFTNTCDRCGADYNWNGDRLADRSQWGEETGESYLDIVSGSEWDEEY